MFLRKMTQRAVTRKISRTWQAAQSDAFPLGYVNADILYQQDRQKLEFEPKEQAGSRENRTPPNVWVERKMTAIGWPRPVLLVSMISLQRRRALSIPSQHQLTARRRRENR
jgi:hypothetical protein